MRLGESKLRRTATPRSPDHLRCSDQLWPHLLGPLARGDGRGRASGRRGGNYWRTGGIAASDRPPPSVGSGGAAELTAVLYSQLADSEWIHFSRCEPRMGKTIVLIHGRSTKPLQADLEQGWIDALRHGLERDHAASLPAFAAARRSSTTATSTTRSSIPITTRRLTRRAAPSHSRSSRPTARISSTRPCMKLCRKRAGAMKQSPTGLPDGSPDFELQSESLNAWLRTWRSIGTRTRRSGRMSVSR